MKGDYNMSLQTIKTSTVKSYKLRRALEVPDPANPETKIYQNLLCLKEDLEESANAESEALPDLDVASTQTEVKSIAKTFDLSGPILTDDPVYAYFQKLWKEDFAPTDCHCNYVEYWDEDDAHTGLGLKYDVTLTVQSISTPAQGLATYSLSVAKNGVPTEVTVTEDTETGVFTFVPVEG